MKLETGKVYSVDELCRLINDDRTEHLAAQTEQRYMSTRRISSARSPEESTHRFPVHSRGLAIGYGSYRTTNGIHG